MEAISAFLHLPEFHWPHSIYAAVLYFDWSLNFPTFSYSFLRSLVSSATALPNPSFSLRVLLLFYDISENMCNISPVRQGPSKIMHYPA